jgi:transcriptional regulator with XRE-family HTH domain
MARYPAPPRSPITDGHPGEIGRPFRSKSDTCYEPSRTPQRGKSDTITGQPQKCPIFRRNRCPVWIVTGVRNESESLSDFDWNRCPITVGIRSVSQDMAATGRFEQTSLPFCRRLKRVLINLPLQNDLGKALQHARRERRWTQRDLARKAGISRPTVRLLESGRGNLSSWERALQTVGLLLQGRSLPPAGSLGRRVAELRKRHGMSQRALARLVNCSHPTIVALEGKGRGRLDLLQRVLEHLGAGVVLRAVGEATPFMKVQRSARLTTVGTLRPRCSKRSME